MREAQTGKVLWSWLSVSRSLPRATRIVITTKDFRFAECLEFMAFYEPEEASMQRSTVTNASNVFCGL